MAGTLLAAALSLAGGTQAQRKERRMCLDSFQHFMFGLMPQNGQEKKKDSEHSNLWAKQKVPLIKI